MPQLTREQAKAAWDSLLEQYRERCMAVSELLESITEDEEFCTAVAKRPPHEYFKPTGALACTLAEFSILDDEFAEKRIENPRARNFANRVFLLGIGKSGALMAEEVGGPRAGTQVLVEFDQQYGHACIRLSLFSDPFHEYWIDGGINLTKLEARYRDLRWKALNNWPGKKEGV